MKTTEDKSTKSLPSNDDVLINFRKHLIQKSIFLNWLKKLLIYGITGGITGGALSAAITGSLVLANVLTVGFFTVTPVLPILIITGAAIIAFFATVAYKSITDIKNNISPKEVLKIYEKLETNKDGKTYIEIYFEKNNPGKELKKVKKEIISDIINEWDRYAWKVNDANKTNWSQRYLQKVYQYQLRDQENHRKIRRN